MSTAVIARENTTLPSALPRREKRHNAVTACETQLGRPLTRTERDRVDCVLTQQEIDELLRGILGGWNDGNSQWKTIDEFSTFLTKRNAVPEQHYGIFEKDVSVCRFFDDKKGEGILADIMAKNTETGMGNVCIPNTDIKLVNYSYCPTCGKIFTQQMLKDYYNKPVVRPGNNLRYALRKETRVVCDDCGTAFLPTLIIVDGSPKNSVQYLCRNQVIDAIELYMGDTYHEQVLTRNKKNIRSRGDGMVGCANDLMISKLEKRPALITNFIQYTPPPMILNFIDQKNIENNDIVFDSWQKRQSRDYEERMLRVYP